MSNADDFLSYRETVRAKIVTLKPPYLVRVFTTGPDISWEHFDGDIAQYNVPTSFDVNEGQRTKLVGWHEPFHELEEWLCLRDLTKAHRQAFLTLIGETRSWDELKAIADAKPTQNEQHDADPGEWWADAGADAIAGVGKVGPYAVQSADPAALLRFFLSLLPQPTTTPEVPKVRTIIDYYSPHDEATMRCWAQNGVTGIARYLVQSPNIDARAITPTEVETAHRVGLSVHFFFEMNPTTPQYFTRAQGQNDAVAAVAHLQWLGAPRGSVVYFTVDAPPSTIPVNLLDAYVAGIEDTLTSVSASSDPAEWPITPGLYGFEAHIEYARTRFASVGKHLAQTYGTPRGPLDLWQHEQKALCGIAVDIDDCYVDGWKGDDMTYDDLMTEIKKRLAAANAPDENFDLANTIIALKAVDGKQDAAARAGAQAVLDGLK